MKLLITLATVILSAQVYSEDLNCSSLKGMVEQYCFHTEDYKIMAS